MSHRQAQTIYKYHEMWYYVFMTGNFEMNESNKAPDPYELSERDLTILSGDLTELREAIELRDTLELAKFVLHTLCSEEEEEEEPEE